MNSSSHLPTWFVACVAVLVLPLVGISDGKQDADAKDELAKLQGKWKCVEIEDSEGRVDKGFNKELVTEFKKDVMIDYDVEVGVAARVSIKLNPSKSPKEIDQTTLFNVLYPEEKGKIYRGIYQLEGDTLKIAGAISPWQGERPRGFTTKKGSHFIVCTYKRVKP